MRSAVLIVVCAAAVSGCARYVRPDPPPTPLPAVAPFSDDPVSFLVSVRRFVPGEVTIVRVCVAPDHSILSARVIESSGDTRFDNMAIGWAQSIRMRSAPTNGAPVAPCGEVRVEIRVPSEPKVLSGTDTSLG